MDSVHQFNQIEKQQEIINEKQNESPVKNSESKKPAETSILKNKKHIKDEFFGIIKKQNIFKNLLSKFSSGSLSSSIFSLCILSLGTGSLALPQKIGYMSLFFSPIIIILSGLVNYWSLSVLSNASKKYNIHSYEGIVSYLFGKFLSIFLGVIMSINQSGMIILYQVIIYKLLGGVINEIFALGYDGVEEFTEKSFWNNFSIKFIVCYLIAGFILLIFLIIKQKLIL